MRNANESCAAHAARAKFRVSEGQTAIESGHLTRSLALKVLTTGPTYRRVSLAVVHKYRQTPLWSVKNYTSDLRTLARQDQCTRSFVRLAVTSSRVPGPDRVKPSGKRWVKLA